MDQRKTKHFISALAKGITVLETFTADQQRLTLQELSKLTEFNKTTVQRITDTLIALGYVGRNKRKEFYLEPRILTLGFNYMNGSELRHLGATYLKKYSQKIGQTVNLAVADDLEVVFLFRNEVHGFFSFGLREGSTLPMYCTSSGKVLLASLPDRDLKDKLNRMKLEPFTRFTITDKNVLMEDINKVRSLGYAVADREGTLALYSIAVPIFNYKGLVIAAVNISLQEEKHKQIDIKKMIKSLQYEGGKLSYKLGFSGVYPGRPFRQA